MKLLRATASDGRIFRRTGEDRFHVTGQAQPAVKALASRPSKKSFNAYPAALVTRLNEDWPVAILSADAATRWSLRTLRARSRHLERDGSIATAYLDALEADIIGSRGIGLHMKIQDDGGDRVITPAEQAFYKALNEGVKTYRAADARQRLAWRQQAHEHPFKAAVVKTARHLAKNDVARPGPGTDRYACYLGEKEFKEFSKKGNCDVTGKHSLMDLCRLTLRTSARDGDAILLVYLGYPNKWGLAFQLIEGDYLDDYYNVERLPNGNRVRMGVELDGYGKKVALWVYAHHPGDYGVEGVNSYDPRRRRIPILGEAPDPYFTDGRPEAVQAIHVTRSKRAEETRAVPWMTHVMEIIRHIEVYKEAEVTAARAEACKHKVYTRDLYSSDGTELDWSEDPAGGLNEEMQPAQGEVLPPGYRVDLIDPKHPNPNMPDFMKAMKREVATGVKYCYNILFGDLENVNYSSLRGGLLMQREGSKMDQAWFGSDCFEPIVEIFLRMAILSGALPFRVSEFDRINQKELKFRRWPWCDPKNDAETAQLLLKMKVTTRGRIIADMSSDDYEDIIDELDDEAGYLLGKSNIQEADQREADLENPPPPAPPGNANLPIRENPAKPLKSAFLGDCPISDLHPSVQSTIGDFIPDADPAGIVTRYQMTVPELLDKADPANLKSAQRRLKNRTNKACAAEVDERKDKAILLLNDRIIDGHHHLAKADKGKISRSLPVVDLTPLRHQESAGAPVKGNIEEPRDEQGRWTSGGGGVMAGGVNASYDAAIEEQKANAKGNKFKLKALKDDEKISRAIEPGTHDRMADRAITKAEKDLAGPARAVDVGDELQSDSAMTRHRAAQMEGTMISPKIRASVGIESAIKEIYDHGRVGKIPHPEALPAVEKLRAARSRLGLVEE